MAERDWRPEKYRGYYGVYWRLRYRHTDMTVRAATACPSHAKAVEEACRRARVLKEKFYTVSFRHVIRRLPNPEYPQHTHWYIFTYVERQISHG